SIGLSQQDDIWSTVRKTVKSEFAFKFDDSWAQTVSGYFEALFGWITVNYLLGNLVDPPHHTVGMLDMGGASMQIAYEVPPEMNPPKDLTLSFTIGSKRTYNVYVMTFLGYGTHATKSRIPSFELTLFLNVMPAPNMNQKRCREKDPCFAMALRYKSSLLHNALEYSQYSGLLKLRYRPSTGYIKPPKLANLTLQLHYTTSGEEKFIFLDPCLQPGLEDTLNPRDLSLSRTLLITGNSSSHTVTFLGIGDLSLCIAYQKALLQKHKPCRLDPCSMNGIHQPPVDFEGTQFYAMSEYWYTSSDIGTGLSRPYKFAAFNASASVICETPWHQSLLDYQAKNVESSAILNKQAVCFKASWIINVLHSGFGFPLTYANLYPIDKLSGIDVQWSLGAFIYYAQLPEFELLLAKEPTDPVVGFTHRQTAAFLLLLFIFTCLSISAYCTYCRKQRQRFDFIGGHSTPCCTAPLLLPFKRLWRSPKLVNNGVVPGGVGSGGSVGGGGRRVPSGNYHYLKISSPSLHVNFRPSNSLPSFEKFQDSKSDPPTAWLSGHVGGLPVHPHVLVASRYRSGDEGRHDTQAKCFVDVPKELELPALYRRQTHSLLSKHFVRESEATDRRANALDTLTTSSSSLSGAEARDFYLSLFGEKEAQLDALNAPPQLQSSCSSNCDPNSRSHISSLHHQVAVLSKEPIRPSSLLIPPSNRGYKMLRRLGWIDLADMDIPVSSVDTAAVGAGGLGRQGQGRRLPVATILKSDRLGFGAVVKNRPRITHFAPNDIKAVGSEPLSLRRPRSLYLDKRLQVKRIKVDKFKEIRFRREFHFDDDQLKVLYGEL
ncbi:Ectonucleoside triphosphate diphosphohydrolase 4, partial [Taenia solium]